MSTNVTPYAHWRGLDSDSQTPRYRAICAEIGDNNSVLDIGSGESVLLGRLREQGYSGRYLGLERDSGAVAAGRKRFGDQTIAESSEEDFAGAERFDRIVLSEVLYYLPDPIGTLHRCLDRLIGAGSLLVTIYLRPGRPRIAAFLRGLIDWRIPRSARHCAAMVSRAFPDADRFDVESGTATYRVWRIRAEYITG